MRRMTKPLAIAACLSLLSLQLSGVHVHADDTGYIGVPETSFTHIHGHHDHHEAHHASVDSTDHAGHSEASHTDDYEDARDVSLLDLALGLIKMLLAILALVLLFAVFPLIRTLASAGVVYPILSGRHTRWRPPLRAPPQHA